MVIRLFLCGAVAATLMGPALAASSKPSAVKAAQSNMTATRTVVLDVTGMHCAGCAGPIRDALVKAKGVQMAEVSFEKKQATITYDPKITTPAKLIEVVHNAPNMMGGSTKFEAKVHRGKGS